MRRELNKWWFLFSDFGWRFLFGLIMLASGIGGGAIYGISLKTGWQMARVQKENGPDHGSVEEWLHSKGVGRGCTCPGLGTPPSGGYWGCVWHPVVVLCGSAGAAPGPLAAPYSYSLRLILTLTGRPLRNVVHLVCICSEVGPTSAFKSSSQAILLLLASHGKECGFWSHPPGVRNPLTSNQGILFKMFICKMGILAAATSLGGCGNETW